MNDTVFRLSHVSYRYHGRDALKNINLSVKRGERIVCLGANGSGKSTLLKILDALYYPNHGVFQAFNQTISPEYFNDENNSYEFRKRVGFVFQDPDVQLFSPTVRDEIAFGPLHLTQPNTITGKANKSFNEGVLSRVKWASESLGISHLLDRTPWELSGGEKKKVALASVLSIQPEVWLFDEPTSSLDPRSTSSFIDFIQDITSNNWNLKHSDLEIRNYTHPTIITATHDLTILQDICDRIIVLSEDHTIVADGKPEKILKDTALLRKYNLIHEHRHHHGEKIHRHTHRHS
jgi:cobalt/nickel transport system ATP-binding protein